MNRCAFDVRDSRLVQNLFHHNKIGVIFTKFGDSMSDVNLWVFDCAMESTLVKCRNKTFEMFEMFNLCEGNEVIFWWGEGETFPKMSCICWALENTLNHSFYLAVIHFIVQFEITFSLAHRWINDASELRERECTRNGRDIIWKTASSSSSSSISNDDNDVVDAYIRMLKPVVMCDIESNFD